MGLQGLEMTQSFDEYCKKNQHSGNCTRLEAFSMGQKSRQAEIDNLKQSHHGASIGHDVFIKQLKERHKTEIDELKWMLKNSNGQADEFCKKSNELQKRVDKALVQISNHYHSCIARKDLKRMSASISEIAEIEAHESNMYVLENILKGKQND